MLLKSLAATEKLFCCTDISAADLYASIESGDGQGDGDGDGDGDGGDGD